MSGREYRAAAKGESWKFRLINTIDECMRFARSREEFLALMRSEGYDVRWTDSRKNITYTTPDGLKCRDDRLHDERYLKEAMEREFRIREEIIRGKIEAAEYETRTAAGDSDAGRADAAYCDSMRSAGGGRGDTAYHGADSGGTQNDPKQDGGTSKAAGTGGDTGNADADEGSARTGWEEEREILFSFQPPASGDPIPQSASIMAVGDPGNGGSGAGVVGSVVRLGYALECLQDAPAVSDSTTMHRHTDSKALRTEFQGSGFRELVT